MTTLLDHVPLDEITQARESYPARPGRALLTIILGTFLLIGWLAGHAWMLAVDCMNSVRIGWWRGKGMTAVQIQQRLAPAPQPGPQP